MADATAAGQRPASAHCVPTPDEITEVIGLVPLLATYFQRARSEMPGGLHASFTEHGLSARHGVVLTQLLAGQPLSVTELAARLGVTLPTVSEIVGDLDRAGWVRRRIDPANRRRVLVSLPARHRAEVATYIAVRAAPLLQALRELPAAHRVGFLAGLRIWSREVNAPRC